MGSRDRLARRLLALVTCVVALAGCTTSTTSEPETPSPAAPLRDPRTSPEPGQAAEADLRVMTFNIEYGGEEVDFSSVAKAIVAADADVVAINEGYGNIAKVAADLGWPYYDVRSQIVSRLPLLTPPGATTSRSFQRDAKNTDGARSSSRWPPARWPRSSTCTCPHHPMHRSRSPAAPLETRYWPSSERSRLSALAAGPRDGHQPRRRGHAGVPARRLQRTIRPRLDEARRSGCGTMSGIRSTGRPAWPPRPAGWSTPTALCTPTR